VLLFPQGAAMRLYGSETASLESDDFVQLMNMRLVEVDSLGAEIAGQLLDLTGGDGVLGTWQQTVNTNGIAGVLDYLFMKTSSLGNGGQPTVSLQCRFYPDPTKIPGGSDTALVGAFDGIGSGLGALKITLDVENWQFLDPYNNKLNYQIQVSTRTDLAAAVPSALQTPTGQRYVVGQGNYDALIDATYCDGTQMVGQTLVEYTQVDGGHLISHFFPPAIQSVVFDPILSIASPNDPHYPPYVAPATQGSSVIRDPHDQFAGASTLSAAPATMLAAVFLAAAAVRVF